jgi:hypothetical protein
MTLFEYWIPAFAGMTGMICALSLLRIPSICHPSESWDPVFRLSTARMSDAIRDMTSTMLQIDERLSGRERLSHK